jgi:hypothetical protein
VTLLHQDGPTVRDPAVDDAEALIKEARQRQRKRRLFIGIVVLIAMVVSGVTYAVVSRPSTRARHTRASSPTKTVSPAQSGPFVSPKAPYALAVGPNGDLLVVDGGRGQILRHLPSGKFQVVAGTGKRGFSGTVVWPSAPKSTARLGLPWRKTAPSTSPTRGTAGFERFCPTG